MQTPSKTREAKREWNRNYRKEMGLEKKTRLKEVKCHNCPTMFAPESRWNILCWHCKSKHKWEG